jgi:hypothetical protein
MPEIGLGLGRGYYQDGTRQREVLYWFNQQNQRYLTGEERAQQLQLELERYRQQFGEL